MGSGLTNPDLMTRAYQLAAVLQVQAQQLRLVEVLQALTSVINDVQIRLDETFCLSREQTVSSEIFPRPHWYLHLQQANIRIVALDAVFKPSNGVYRTLHHEVYVGHSASLKLHC
jgi:hypothetical protein